MKIEAYILKYIDAKRNMKFLSLYLCKSFFWRIQKTLEIDFWRAGKKQVCEKNIHVS